LPTQNSFSLDVKASYGKIFLNFVKMYKIKNYTDGNAVTSRDKLKNNYEHASATSMIKLGKHLDTSLETFQVPEVWINELEEFCVRLDDIRSSMSKNQFMIHVLRNLPIGLRSSTCSIREENWR
jgi:hypothetical protein